MIVWQQVQSGVSSLIWNGVRLFFNVTLPLLLFNTELGDLQCTADFSCFQLSSSQSSAPFCGCVNPTPDADTYAWRHIGTFFSVPCEQLSFFLMFHRMDILSSEVHEIVKRFFFYRVFYNIKYL